MDIRTRISEWAWKTFGGINFRDFFHINEIGEWDKLNNVDVMRLIMEVKKDQIWKKEWTSEETVDRWQAEIMSIMGRMGF